MLFNRSNEFHALNKTAAGSTDPTSPDESRKNLRVGNFSTINGMINQASEELTNASIIGNTLAGAKTKYKAQFRIN